MNREAALVATISHAPPDTVPQMQQEHCALTLQNQALTDSCQSQQTQINAMAQQFHAERAEWQRQLLLVQQVPGIPQDAVSLMPILQELLAAPATPIPIQTQSLESAAAAEGLFSGFESQQLQGNQQGDDLYGSSTRTHASRPSPYVVGGHSDLIIAEPVQAPVQPFLDSTTVPAPVE